MEGLKESQNSEYAAEREREREAAIARHTERIGTVLAQVWEWIKEKEGWTPEELEKVRDRKTLRARLRFFPERSPQATIVDVDLLDLNHNDRRENMVLKNFNITSHPPGTEVDVDELPTWNIDEAVAEDGVRYDPLLWKWEEEREEWRKKGKQPYYLQGVRTPSINDMEQVAEALEKSWKLLMSGRRGVLEYKSWMKDAGD